MSAGMDEGYYNFAFPYLREGTGVNPTEDNFVLESLLKSADTKSTTVATSSGTQEPVLSLQGAGVSEVAKVEPVEAAASEVDEATDVETKERLTKEEKKDLQENIAKVQATVAAGPLLVKTFQTGKRQADTDIDKALEAEGNGKSKTKKANQQPVSHSLSFI